ncbi:hypothetical protein PVAP13_1KG157005 [Panicum virgatum]|uniref:Uncharacterized protein n=1 Tax=Panicum virgatum TaxID=38727 RepID=A0A8T0XET4_PANVG|nr:hypothetical protein PVAP13_1KG157005 [Panicum virgatum]
MLHHVVVVGGGGPRSALVQLLQGPRRRRPIIHCGAAGRRPVSSRGLVESRQGVHDSFGPVPAGSRRRPRAAGEGSEGGRPPVAGHELAQGDAALAARRLRVHLHPGQRGRPPRVPDLPRAGGAGPARRRPRAVRDVRQAPVQPRRREDDVRAHVLHRRAGRAGGVRPAAGVPGHVGLPGAVRDGARIQPGRRRRAPGAPGRRLAAQVRRARRLQGGGFRLQRRREVRGVRDRVHDGHGRSGRRHGARPCQLQVLPLQAHYPAPAADADARGW